MTVAKWMLAVVITTAAVTTVSATPLMYVPTGGADDLVVIDMETDRVVDRIDELENAHGLAASPNSDFLVAGSMRPVDSDEARNMSRPNAVTEQEHEAHHSGAGNTELKSDSYLSIVHPEHGHVMRRIAVPGLTHHTAVSPDGRFAIAVHTGLGAISIIDLKEMELVETLKTGSRPNYAVFSSDGKHLYISNAGSGNISEIDTGDWSIRREFVVGKSPEHMVLSPNNATLFVANVDEDRVVAVDIGGGKVARSFSVAPGPHGIDISANGLWLFVSSKAGQRLSRIDLRNGSLTDIDLQPAPYHVAYAADVGKLYVSSRLKPLIWVINPENLTIDGKIDIGKGVAHQMVVLP